MFSDTFAGIAPASVPGYVIAQLVGGVVAIVVLRTLYPGVTPREAADVILPHLTDGQPQIRTDVPAIAAGGDQMTQHLSAVGGSDAGISAALRAHELDPSCEFTVVVADAYPNFSRSAASPTTSPARSRTGATSPTAPPLTSKRPACSYVLNTVARRLDAPAHTNWTCSPAATVLQDTLSYDALIVGTGALPVRPAIEGLTGPDALGPEDGVHLLHSMGDTFALMRTLERQSLQRAVIVGAGYIGLEMAEGLTARGLEVTQLEQLP